MILLVFDCTISLLKTVLLLRGFLFNTRWMRKEGTYMRALVFNKRSKRNILLSVCLSVCVKWALCRPFGIHIRHFLLKHSFLYLYFVAWLRPFAIEWHAGQDHRHRWWSRVWYQRLYRWWRLWHYLCTKGKTKRYDTKQLYNTRPFLLITCTIISYPDKQRSRNETRNEESIWFIFRYECKRDCHPQSKIIAFFI